MRPMARARSPDRFRARGGLRPVSGGSSTCREPSKAGRSSTILRSTSIGSDRDGDNVGGAGPGVRGGEAGALAECVDASLWELKVRFRKRSRMEGMSARAGVERISVNASQNRIDSTKKMQTDTRKK